MNVAKEFEMNGITFEDFFVDENLKASFRYSKQFSGINKFTVDLNTKTMVAYTASGKIELSIISDIPADFISKVIQSELEINNDLKKYSKRLKGDVEPILVLPLDDDNVPFMITTPTILSKGQYSPKYQLGLLYYINLQLRSLGKGEYETIAEAIIDIGKKIKEKNLTFQIKIDGQSTYFETSLSELIDLI